MKLPDLSRFRKPKSLSRKSSSASAAAAAAGFDADHHNISGFKSSNYSPSSSSSTSTDLNNSCNQYYSDRIVTYDFELQMDHVKEAFMQFDVNRDGKISPEEVMAVMAAIYDSSNNITLEEARKMVAAADANDDGFVDIHEFVQLLNGRPTELFDDVRCSSRSGSSCSNNVDGAGPSEIVSTDEDLVAAFAVFDTDHDGFITADELWRVLRQLPGNGACSLDDCRRMISRVDRKGVGHVDFEDFVLMMSMK